MIQTSPKSLRFPDHFTESDFLRRYHVRSSKHTQKIMIVALFIVALQFFVAASSWKYQLFLFSGPVVGWLLCEWKYFHKFGQTIAPVLFAIFFIGVDAALSNLNDGHHEGHITYLVQIHIFAAYTMLRLLFLPSVCLGLSISIAHLAILYFGHSDWEVINRALPALGMANLFGCFVSLSFEKHFRRMFLSKNSLVTEKNLQDRILDNIIPASLGKNLRDNFQDIIISCPKVAVVAADLTNFTAFSLSVSTDKLVDILNKIYTEFDHLADRYGLTKIKTMGDAILLVSGIDEKIDALGSLKFAIAMRNSLQRIAGEECAALDIRIGIAVGPCQAGVVGETRPKFDVWGLAVKAAEELEKHTAHGSISVSDGFKELLSGEEEFTHLLSQVCAPSANVA